MKRNTTPSKKINTPVRDDVEEDALETNEPMEEPKAQLVMAKATYRVKCVWSGPVKVSGNSTPSGKAYDFRPQQELPIDNKPDMIYLTGLTKKQTGCCGGGSGEEVRHYFELV